MLHRDLRGVHVIDAWLLDAYSDFLDLNSFVFSVLGLPADFNTSFTFQAPEGSESTKLNPDTQPSADRHLGYPADFHTSQTYGQLGPAPRGRVCRGEEQARGEERGTAGCPSGRHPGGPRGGGMG